MKISEIAAWMPVVEMTREEIDMSVAKFRNAYLTGKIDHGHPAAGYLVSLVRIGQNVQKAVV